MHEAIVLAGGFGTRLRQAVPNLPKSMAPISGRPFLAILLDSLAHKGFDRVVLSVGFMAEKIVDYFGPRFSGMQLVYVMEEQPLGTGGAVRLAMPHCHHDHVFVFNGDTFLALEVDAVDRHWQYHRHAVIVGREMPDTTRYGRLLTANGQVTGFTEKGVSGSGLINAGCYLFNQGQLDAFLPNTPFALETDYLVKAVSEIPIDVFVTAGQFIDIGVPDDFLRAQIELVRRCE